jgi:penicillin-binding protein 2
MFSFFRKKRKLTRHIDADEILLDSENLSSLDTQQFEGRIEKPISKKTLNFLFSSFIVISLVFAYQLTSLQIAEGESYLQKSRNNSLSQRIIFSDRGVIYDRYKKELAWNTASEKDDDFPIRSYIDDAGFGHVLGYVGYPEKDSKGFYWQKEFIGKGGIEKEFNESLNGRNGLELIERNVQGEIQSENTVEAATDGENITLTIDAELQAKLHESIVDLTERSGFAGGAGLVMDIHTGELLAMTSYPEYDPEILSLGEDRAKINSYISNNNKAFLNRTLVPYTPGSIVKPYLALAALKEGIIDPNEWLVSNGQIVIPNPYDPDNPSIFKDNDVHGMVDMRKAIAVSANTYFYEIGGGFNGREGLGISRIEKYIREFGFGKETGFVLEGEEDGIIPNPEWKKKVFADGTWRLGDTYNSSIGQYGFQLTPIQALQAVASVANKGELVTPQIIMDAQPEKEMLPTTFTMSDYRIIHEGMRQTVTDGTAQLLNVSGVEAAAKTGTAQTGSGNKFSHSWTTGFFPYENPKYAFVVFMEKAPRGFQLSSNFAMRQTLLWMVENRPEYVN